MNSLVLNCLGYAMILLVNFGSVMIHDTPGIRLPIRSGFTQLAGLPDH